MNPVTAHDTSSSVGGAPPGVPASRIFATRSLDTLRRQGVWVPVLGAGACLYLMAGLPVGTWIRLLAWLALGMAIYLVYGRRGAEKVRMGEAVEEQPRGIRTAPSILPGSSSR